MKIKLIEKPIELGEYKGTLKISLLLGWYKPNLCIEVPNMIISSTPLDAIIRLMDHYSKKDFENDETERELKRYKVRGYS